MTGRAPTTLGRRAALTLAGSLLLGTVAAGCGRTSSSTGPSPSTESRPTTEPHTPGETPGSAGPATSASQPSSSTSASGQPSSLDPSNPPSTVPATSSSPAPAPTTATATAKPEASQSAGTVKAGLRPGAKGSEVVVLQQRLNHLGFWVGPADGDFGDQTRQGVAAAQKAAHIPIDAYVGPITTKALNAGIALTPRSQAGHVLEVDKARQLLLVVDDGRVTRYYNTSTGGGYRYYNKGSGQWEVADTPAGSFTVSRQVDGWDPGPLGAIYRPMYFNGGVAVHGTNADVLAHPKSHGCVRLTLPMMDEIRRSGQIKVGTRVIVY